MKFKLVENLNKQLVEEWLNDEKTVFMSDSEYQVKNMLLGHPEMRIVYDKENDMYILGHSYFFHHDTLLKLAKDNGYYDGIRINRVKNSKMFTPIVVGGRNYDESALADNYTYKYAYDNGLNVYCFDDVWNEIPLSKIMGPYKTYECIVYNRGFEEIKPREDKKEGEKKKGLFSRH